MRKWTGWNKIIMFLKQTSDLRKQSKKNTLIRQVSKTNHTS